MRQREPTSPPVCWNWGTVTPERPTFGWQSVVDPRCSVQPPMRSSIHHMAASSSGEAQLKDSCSVNQAMDANVGIGPLDPLRPEFPPIQSGLSRDRFREVVGALL